jgi:hypothetical protein
MSNPERAELRKSTASCYSSSSASLPPPDRFERDSHWQAWGIPLPNSLPFRLEPYTTLRPRNCIPLAKDLENPNAGSALLCRKRIDPACHWLNRDETLKKHPTEACPGQRARLDALARATGDGIARLLRFR